MVVIKFKDYIIVCNSGDYFGDYNVLNCSWGSQEDSYPATKGDCDSARMYY